MGKKFAIVTLALALTLALSLPALARTMVSDLGYSIQLPKGWLALEKSKLQNKPKAINAAVETAQKDQGIEAIPGRVLQGLKKLLDQGKIDLYYSDTPGFYITVLESVGNIADKAGNTDQICRDYKENLASEAGKMVMVQECGPASVDARYSMRLVATDYQKGKKFIQYLVQKTDTKILLFTATSKSADFDTMNSDFSQLMKTVKME